MGLSKQGRYYQRRHAKGLCASCPGSLTPIEEAEGRWRCRACRIRATERQRARQESQKAAQEARRAGQAK